MKNLRTIALLFSIIVLLSAYSCAQNTDIAAMLENTETRNEIFNTIANDREMMSSFMETIQKNENAMQMMQGNTHMMGHMMKGGGMQMMMKDSMILQNMMGNNEMMHTMMGKMIMDGEMMNNMMQMMAEDDMMSKECLDNMAKKMQEKGMTSNKMKN